MIPTDFTPEDIDALHPERFHHPHPRVQGKMEAVHLRSQGLPHKGIRRSSRIREHAPRSYLGQSREGGVERLKRLDFAAPRGAMADRREELEDDSRKDPPRSTGEAAAPIERITGIRRGPTQVRKPLTGMGLECRELGMIPAEAEADVPRGFPDEELRPRLRQARRLRRVACSVDAAHLVRGPYLGYPWCFVRLLMRGPSGRERFNVLGAIDAVTHGLTTVCNDTVVNAETVCERLRALAARYVGRPSTPVLGDARYQECEVVRSLAAGLGIEPLYLPSSSPKLNLIERLWEFVKEECLSCRHYADFARFKGAIAERLDGVEGRHKSSIRSLLTLNSQTFEEPQLLAG